jgi:electron transfer flavoprotein alpha subunit
MCTSIYGRTDATDSLWIYLERAGDGFRKVSLELLAKGRELADAAGWPLVGLMIGYGATGLSDLAFAHGAHAVWAVEHPLLAEFSVDGYTHAAFKALLEGRPSAFLIGATHDGRDLAGRLAVRLRTGLNADCTDLAFDPERKLLISQVTGFGGGVIARLECPEARPQMSTVRPGIFRARQGREGSKGELIELTVDLDEARIRTRVVERIRGEGIDLTQAPALVCGGRGMEGEFAMLAEVAALLGGEVGGTRPPVDEGHIPRERQVGQTGVVCRPKVALACGISGAFHFVVGIQESDLIIAINVDPEAPIFEFADYCVVADAKRIIPALAEALERQGAGVHV